MHLFTTKTTSQYVISCLQFLHLAFLDYNSKTFTVIVLSFSMKGSQDVFFRLADLRQQVSDLKINTPIIAHGDIDEELAVKKAATLQEFTDTEELLRNVEKRKRGVNKTCQLLKMTIFTYIMYHV